MPYQLKTLINCDELVSVNRRLAKGGKRGKHLSPPVQREIAQLTKSLEDRGIQRNSVDPNKFYTISLIFYLKGSIFRRDLDNMVKIVIDAITPYLGFNDNKIISYRLAKRQIKYPEDYQNPKEWVYLEVTETDKSRDDLQTSFEDFKSYWKIN